MGIDLLRRRLKYRDAEGAAASVVASDVQVTGVASPVDHPLTRKRAAGRAPRGPVWVNCEILAVSI
jgi:hypothetical protein